MSLKVLVLGINGFIGNSLCRAILDNTDWDIYGMDMADDKLGKIVDNPRFHFIEGDVTINREWISYHIKKCDVVLPLVAIATPATYVSDPLRVFELDFESNLDVIRQAVKHNTRVIFPSTSEVYGMTPVAEFNEYETPLTLGPINKERWIYSCSKQLLDRVIHAYGKHNGLQFTLFRPFNWYGPKLDNIKLRREGGSRVLTQFISNIIHGESIKLVDGGQQKRSFTYIDDGIDALMKIIENKNGCADGRIFNVGNPSCNISIKELAESLVTMIADYPDYRDKAKATKIIDVTSQDYYGDGYQDVQLRVPSIAEANKHLDWQPKIDLQQGLRQTLDYHLARPDYDLGDA